MPMNFQQKLIQYVIATITSCGKKIVRIRKIK